jgi:hypothetical protein
MTKVHDLPIALQLFSPSAAADNLHTLAATWPITYTARHRGAAGSSESITRGVRSPDNGTPLGLDRATAAGSR